MDKKILLWLDDMRDPMYNAQPFDGEIVWVRSYAEFTSYINKNGLPDKISFDYSLNDNSYDGISCVKSVIVYCEKNTLAFPKYAIHSTHPQVYKLRDYISKHIHFYDMGDAVEEDRLPDTEDQALENLRQGGDVSVLMSGGYDKYIDKLNSLSLPSDLTARKIAPKNTPVLKTDKIGRNELCSCSSGLKYKRYMSYQDNYKTLKIFLK